MADRDRGREQEQAAEDVSELPGDQRIQYDELRREQRSEDIERSPSPYDLASDDMPEDRVITKGERERAGPTQAPRDAEQTDVADSDGLLQSSQIDRRESSRPLGGPGPEQNETFDSERRDHRGGNEGDLGGDGLHRRINEGESDQSESGDVTADDLDREEMAED